MREQLARKLGLREDAPIFFASAGFMVVFLVVLIAVPGLVEQVFLLGRQWIVENLGWFFISGVSAWLVFLLWIAVSRYGTVRLGDPGDRLTYSNVSWFTMLFAGGIGTVQMFWGSRNRSCTSPTRPSPVWRRSRPKRRRRP